MKRQHPSALIGYTSQKFWLLLIPLIRGLAAIRFDISRWAEGAKWDILVIAVMIAAAVIQWYFTLYDIKDKCIRCKKGMLIKTMTEIPFDKVCAATAEETPINKFFKTVRVYVDTDAASGRRKSADISLLMFREDRAKLFNNLKGNFIGENKEISYSYKAPFKSLAAFSFLFSSALSGIILLITVLSAGTKMIGTQLNEHFLAAVTDLSDAAASSLRYIIDEIPPAGIAISIIIAIGFLLSFSENVIRHYDFSSTRQGKCILISCGIITRRMHCINLDKVNIADMRQNLLMKAFGIASVHISCTGYGKRKNEMPVFIPVCSIKKLYDGKDITELSHVMKMLLPDFSECESYINPKTSYIGRFIYKPSILVFLILAAALLAVVYFPEWYSLITFLCIIAEIPAVWLLIAKACAYCTTGFNINSSSVCIKYSKRYDFHTITVPIERVAQIRMTQNIFQRIGNSCDVIVYTNAEQIGGHKVKNMPIAEIQELVRERY